MRAADAALLYHQMYNPFTDPYLNQQRRTAVALEHAIFKKADATDAEKRQQPDRKKEIARRFGSRVSDAIWGLEEKRNEKKYAPVFEKADELARGKDWALPGATPATPVAAPQTQPQPAEQSTVAQIHQPPAEQVQQPTVAQPQQPTVTPQTQPQPAEQQALADSMLELTGPFLVNGMDPLGQQFVLSAPDDEGFRFVEAPVEGSYIAGTLGKHPGFTGVIPAFDKAYFSGTDPNDLYLAHYDMDRFNLDLFKHEYGEEPTDAENREMRRIGYIRRLNWLWRKFKGTDKEGLKQGPEPEPQSDRVRKILPYLSMNSSGARDVLLS